MPNNVIKKTKSEHRQKGWFWPAVITFALIVIIVSSFYAFASKISRTDIINTQIGNENFSLEVADTDAKRVKGLSERDKLAQNNGMLFDFKQDGDWRMWMVQMRFPLDMIWLNAEKQVIYVKENARPADFPERYSAKQPSRYVIELNSGAVSRIGIKVGDYIVF